MRAMKTIVCETCTALHTTRADKPGRFCSRLCANRGISFKGMKRPRRQPAEERFWSKVEKSDGCWIWKAQRDKDGYGCFKAGGKMYRAHRYAYELTYGIQLGSNYGCHSCDNPSCVRPDHISPGTAKDNFDDAYQKGRATPLIRANKRVEIDPTDITGPGGPGVPGDDRPRYTRDKTFDKRTGHPEAWRDQFGLVRWVAVGVDPNRS